MLEYTKCDAIMIGRGVLGNPWLIKEIDTYLHQQFFLQSHKLAGIVRHRLKLAGNGRSER